MDLLAQSIATCRSRLAAYAEAPEAEECWQALREGRIAVASALVGMGRKLIDGKVLQPVLELQHKISASGAFDHALPPEDRTLATESARKGVAGVVAAMLVAPAWQWPQAPAYAAIPEGLWPAYTAWLFAAPQGFRAEGQTEVYGAHILRRLEELDRLVATNRTGKTLPAVLGVFAAVASGIPLYFTGGSLSRHMELRGRLLSAWGRRDRVDDLPARPRTGRRLRVGFINRHFGSQTESYTTLPTFEHLDPKEFEVCLFAHHYRDTPLEKYARSRAASFTQLPEKCEDQLKVLRAAELDVAVFGTNVTAVCHEVTLLALHRVAPLQVVNNSSCTTSGLPNIDLYVSGTATETNDSAGHFTERLGLVHGPAHAFNYEADRQEPSRRWTRAALGIPDGAVVFVSAANYFKITPEMRQTWARLLAAVPGSRILLHPFNPNWSSQYPIKRFRSEMESALAGQGVELSRFVLSTNRFPSRSDVKALLEVGDVYLDTFPFGGVNSLVDPLELGLPVVAWEGETMRARMGAALLRQLGLGELIARDETGYRALAAGLALDAVRRESVRARIKTAMEAPLFLDTLAASDLFGSVLTTAFDERVAVGLKAFRSATGPVRSAPTVPLDVVSRVQHAHTLLAAGRAERAVDYLLAAVNREPDDAGIWLDLAQALQGSDRKSQALQALQVAVRLAPTDCDAWSKLASLAGSLGFSGLAAEARRSVENLSKPATAANGLAAKATPDAAISVSQP